MGANMIVAMAPAARYISADTEESHFGPDLVTDAEVVMARVTPEVIESARALLLHDDNQYNLLDDREETIEKLDELAPEEALPDEEILDVIRDALKMVLDPDCREIAHVRPRGAVWQMVSGGSSWGDSPTEAAERLWFLAELGVTDEAFPTPQG